MTTVETKPLAQRHREKKYTPNLSGFISQCERNYMQLQRLMTNVDDGCCWQFNVQETHLTSQLIEISIVERCTYTTSLKIKQILQDKVCKENDNNIKASHAANNPNSMNGEHSNTPLISEPEMYVRLYHDAKMAEVLSCQSTGNVKPSYTYPNKKMHQKNEKSQWNAFLGEWLSHCIKTGYSAHTVLSFQ